MEQRYSRRIPVSCSVVFAKAGRIGEGRVIDVSSPGCLVESLVPFHVGESVRLRLFLPDHQAPLNVLLAVVRRVEGRLVALEFIRTSQSDQIRLSRFIRTHTPFQRQSVRSWAGSVELLAASGE